MPECRPHRDLAMYLVSKQSERCARLATSVLAFFLGGLISAAAVAEDVAEAPSSVDEIVLRLKAQEEAIETLQATYLCLSKHTILRPGAKHDPRFPIADNLASLIRRSKVTWEATRDGRGRIEAVQQATNVRDDGTSFESRETIVSAFNGATGRMLTTDRQRKGTDMPAIGQATQRFERTHSSPFDMTTHDLGSPVSKLLEEGRATVVAMERWEDRPVVVLEVAPVTVRNDYIYRQRFWIDVERGAAVRRQSFVQRGEGMTWGLHYQVDAKQFSEVSPGIWLPSAVDIWNYYVSTAGQNFLSGKEDYAIMDWKINEAIDPSRFELEYPEGTLDTDHPELGQLVPARQ